MMKVAEAARPTTGSQVRQSSKPLPARTKRKGSRLTPTSLLRRKSRSMFRHLTLALTGDTEAIHQLRVSGRRLRVALLLLSAKPDGRRARRVQTGLRQLTRTAGEARDLDVLVEAYGAHLRALANRTGEQRRLLHQLRNARRSGRARMTEKVLDADWKGLRHDLAILAGGAQRNVLLLGRRMRALAASEGRILSKGFARVGAVLDPSELHRLRRKARRLRYAVEVWDESFELSSDATKPWKALQESIGAIHDYDMLSAWFDRQAASHEARDRHAIAAVARSEAGWARTTMAKLHDALLASAPAALVRQGLSALEISMLKQ